MNLYLCSVSECHVTNENTKCRSHGHSPPHCQSVVDSCSRNMAALVRSQTNLEEVETTPFAHKYMLKRPRLRQTRTTNSIDLSTNARDAGTAHISSNGTAHNRPASSPQEPGIDNPAVEKRESFQRAWEEKPTEWGRS